MNHELVGRSVIAYAESKGFEFCLAVGNGFTTKAVQIFKRIRFIIVNIDNKRLNMSELQRLVWNDGFDNIYEFVSYFNEDFVGKIIHWTDFRY